MWVSAYLQDSVDYVPNSHVLVVEIWINYFKYAPDICSQAGREQENWPTSYMQSTTQIV